MKCPRCESDKITVTKRDGKVSLFGAGLKGELVAICQQCGKSFDPEIAYWKQQKSMTLGERQEKAMQIKNQISNAIGIEEISFEVDSIPDSVFIAPNIPEKKASNAVNAYAPTITVNDILILIDTSLFGNGKTGVVLTYSCLYYKEIGVEKKN